MSQEAPAPEWFTYFDDNQTGRLTRDQALRALVKSSVLLDVPSVLAALDPSSVVTVADKIINGKLQERLEDSSIRLVRTSWLLSDACPAVMPRRLTSGAFR